MNITVASNQQKERLDIFVVSQLPHLSRTFVQKQIERGEILVNNARAASKYTVAPGDVITVGATEKPMPKIVPTSSILLAIVAETPDYIVINKQAGVVMHPAFGVTEPTLADALVGAYPELAHVGDDALRPGLVHRIDRDVSGVLVIARTQDMFEHLKAQFQNRIIEKEYIALVHGDIAEDGFVDTPIGRSKTKSGKMAAHPSREDAEEATDDKTALTEYTVLEHGMHYTLLRVRIHTGRTHQIRVHLTSIGHPIAGDVLYHVKRFKLRHMGRLFLHSALLKFFDLEGKQQTFEAPLPKELESVLESMR